MGKNKEIVSVIDFLQKKKTFINSVEKELKDPKKAEKIKEELLSLNKSKASRPSPGTRLDIALNLLTAEPMKSGVKTTTVGKIIEIRDDKLLFWGLLFNPSEIGKIDEFDSVIEKEILHITNNYTKDQIMEDLCFFWSLNAYNLSVFPQTHYDNWHPDFLKIVTPDNYGEFSYLNMICFNSQLND